MPLSSPIIINPLKDISGDPKYRRFSPISPSSPSSTPRPQSVVVLIQDKSPDKVNAMTAPVTSSNIIENTVGQGTGKDTKTYITAERLAELRRMVDDAVKEHRVFTIRGGWQTLRRAFLRRNWIEKCDCATRKPPSYIATSIDELCVNLPTKQSWETQSAHVMKCERTIMSRLLQVHEVDFYWNTRKDNHDLQFRLTCNKLMSRFARSLFTSKEGLCLLLQQMYWHNEPGVASVNFPRCYVLGFPDHYNNFVEDFRITACISLLKYFIHLSETQDQYSIQSPEGQVPYSTFQFAIDRLNEFIATKKHMDIDVDIPVLGDNDWAKFMDHFQMIVHQKHKYLENKNYIIAVLTTAAKAILKKMQPYWPQMGLDGMKNIWIMKPGNKCRGKGIQLIKDVKDVGRIMDMKLKYVVQKYIERPLLIFNTKFDIRQWFLITSVQPLIIWMYKESYLRFSSQTFNLDNFHESLHLTNHAVQCKYKNTMNRDKALPDDNMWDCYMFQAFLKNSGQLNKWETVIYPGMREAIIGSMLSCQDTMDRRPNTFELYGADFILAEDYQPWLLEINSSPDLSSSTSVTARMCPQVLEDLVKVVIDKKRDSTCDTGFFICIYKQNFPRPPAYLGMNLSVRGRRLFKRSKSRKDKENESNNIKKNSLLIKRNPRLMAPILTNESLLASESNQGCIYSGPVIADLIEEIQKDGTSLDSDPNDGIELAQPLKKGVIKKKFKATGHSPNVSNNKFNESGCKSTEGGSLCPRIIHRLQMTRYHSSRSSRQSVNSKTPRTALRRSIRHSQRHQHTDHPHRVTTGSGVDIVVDDSSRDQVLSIGYVGISEKFNKDRNKLVNNQLSKESLMRVAYVKSKQLESLDLLQKLRELQVLQLNGQEKEENSGLLTVGRSLCKLMRPHT